jgi:hypothetical protein
MYMPVWGALHTLSCLRRSCPVLCALLLQFGSCGMAQCTFHPRHVLLNVLA